MLSTDGGEMMQCQYVIQIVQGKEYDYCKAEGDPLCEDHQILD